MDMSVYCIKAANRIESAVVRDLLTLGGYEDRTGSRWLGGSFPYISVRGERIHAYEQKYAMIPISIQKLLEYALRGFKEVYEVPPEGYRLLTDAEKKLPVPKGAMFTTIGGSLWITSVSSRGRPCLEPSYVIAVPNDYVFDTRITLTIEGEEVKISLGSAKAIKEALKNIK